jgi:Fe-Mn family superoxide dismutase
MKPSLLNLNGISQRQITEHFDILYKGYVKKVNEISEKLPHASKEEANPTYSCFRELKLEETFARNGAVLHELYFLNLGGYNREPSNLLIEALARSFGSYKEWEKDFKATALSARGWAMLVFDPRDENLRNYLLDAHNIGVVIHSMPLLVLDVYEHAYFIDYGARRKPYVDAFMSNIDWDVVNQRFRSIMEWYR